jgi:hypothetical protein
MNDKHVTIYSMRQIAGDLVAVDIEIGGERFTETIRLSGDAIPCFLDNGVLARLERENLEALTAVTHLFERVADGEAVESPMHFVPPP